MSGFLGETNRKIQGNKRRGNSMKNIQYELIINEALRSALEYDIPDEQINEFIGFFGKHIGSDRIYIFEDNVKKKSNEQHL